jgi:hypothetical protein
MNTHLVVPSALMLIAAAVRPSAADDSTKATTSPIAHPMSVSVSAMLVLPSGDASTYSDDSLGVRATFSYRVTPYIAPVASFDYVMVNAKQNVVGQMTDLGFYAFDFGARFTLPRPGVQPFGEFLIGSHNASASGAGAGVNGSNLGFRFGVGLTVPAGDQIAWIAELSYSSATIDRYDIDGFGFEGGVAFSF